MKLKLIALEMFALHCIAFEILALNLMATVSIRRTETCLSFDFPAHGKHALVLHSPSLPKTNSVPLSPQEFSEPKRDDQSSSPSSLTTSSSSVSYHPSFLSRHVLFDLVSAHHSFHFRSRLQSLNIHVHRILYNRAHGKKS